MCLGNRDIWPLYNKDGELIRPVWLSVVGTNSDVVKKQIEEREKTSLNKSKKEEQPSGSHRRKDLHD